MVKLKIYVRVIPESAYGADTSTAPPRKFVVVVRDPAEWFIGTLAREAQRTYQRLYRQDLGKVKYLKDGDDNDLDPEQYVSDIFVNEGKAARDGLDQEAIIKIIQEQGHAVRADSVVPDLTPTHYSQPPISRLPATSSLGKRAHDAIGGSQALGSAKRSKLVEIPESQEVVPSVEQSPELIHDTQREALEDDVFDDAKEYHQERIAPTRADLPPVTPPASALPNGTVATKSPEQQASSSASRFKIRNHRDVYAYPESDIEDSQMATDRPTTLNGLVSSQLPGHSSNQNEGIPKAVADFDAQKALFPMDLDEPPQPPARDSANLLSQKRKPAAPAKGKSPESHESESDRDAPVLKVPKSRQQPTTAKDRNTTTSPQAKRQKTPSRTNGVAQEELTYVQEKKSTPPILTDKTEKQQKTGSISEKGQLKPALSLSPSRRTSGVVSELDSPGEQLSQALRDSATGQRLAEGVQAALGSKQSKKKQRMIEKRKQNASKSGSSSASSSRPASREGPITKSAPKNAAKKTSTEVEAGKKHEAQAEAKSTKPAKSKPAMGEKTNGEPPKSFKDKLADASARAVTEISDAVSARRKVDAADSEDGSESEDDGAPLPSIENTPVAPAKVSSSLPVPKWGPEPNEPKSAAVRASPAFIVPVGMTEEEYIRLRAKNELTPQPPKITPAAKRKASTPATTAKAATSVANDAITKGKQVAEKAVDMAQAVAKKTIAVGSSSEEEDSSSYEDSDNAVKDNKKGPLANKSTSANATSKAASKSTSPVESRKTQAVMPPKSTEKATMPPPTPKSTAKRQESTKKQPAERSSSSASTHTSSTSSQQTTSKASSSSSPAPTKTPARTPAKPKPQPSTTANKPKQQPTPAAAANIKPERPAVPMKRESALKALRAKINSEAASPAPSLSSVRAKKKAPAIMVDSSSEEEESSESSEEEEGRKQSLGKKKVDTPLKVMQGSGMKKPDPSVRNQEKESSSSSSGSSSSGSSSSEEESDDDE